MKTVIQQLSLSTAGKIYRWGIIELNRNLQTTNRESTQTRPRIPETITSLGSVEKLEQLYVANPRTVLIHLLGILGVGNGLILSLFTVIYDFGDLLPAQGTAVTYLSAIAGAQASVLAIGVSVLLLGFELIANRYSTQLTSIILENPVFPTTFALLIGSIALDLWLIFNIEGLYAPISIFGYTELISIIVGLLLYLTAPVAFLSALTLYFTVRHGVRNGTPEGVVKSFRNQLSPDKYVSQALQSEEDETILHPLADLNFIISDSIQKQEPRIVHMAFDVYSSKLLAATEHAMEGERVDLLSDANGDYGGPLFKPVLKSQLPRIINADLQSQQEITEKASNLLQELSSNTQKDEEYNLAVPIAFSYVRIVDKAPLTQNTENYLSNIIINLGDLIRARIHQGQYSNVVTICRHSMTIVDSDVSPQNKPAKQILYAFLGEIADSFVSIEDTYRGSPLLVLGGQVSDTRSETIRELTKLFLRCVALLIDSSPDSEQSQRIQSLWETVLTISRNTVSDRYLEILCQGVIETTLLFQEKSADFDQEEWTNLLARTMEHQGPETVLNAFDAIGDRKYTTSSHWGTEKFWDDLDSRNYSSGILPSSQHPTSTYSNTGAINEIRDQVLDEYRRRNWDNKFIRRFVQNRPGAVESGLSIRKTDVEFDPVDYLCRDKRNRAVHLVICEKFYEEMLSQLDLTGIQRTIIISAREPEETEEIREALEYDDLEICLMDFVDRPEPSQTQLREFFRDARSKQENSGTDIKRAPKTQSTIPDYG
ncbi:DUF2254 domain-containing protein [Haloarcula amylovorans]|uniref:hypothetical protein n=1 Tax=Haloarcula amylovorans TaxID=2562280 RepID=UPI0010763489|nr:hypothetical protein [Halomicroarcula amylolytica]